MIPIKILLVEDSPTQAAVSRHDLETISPDVEVHIIENATQAVKFLQTRGQNLDLMVLDLTLPDGSGLDICRMAKTNAATREVPVIVFSTEPLSTRRQAAYGAGADHYISKGSTGDATLKLVASTLLRKKLRRLPRLGETLITCGYLTVHQLQQALNAQESGQTIMLGQWLVQKGFISAEQLQEALEIQRDSPRP